jgi:hypothetical protein
MRRGGPVVVAPGLVGAFVVLLAAERRCWFDVVVAPSAIRVARKTKHTDGPSIVYKKIRAPRSRLKVFAT